MEESILRNKMGNFTVIPNSFVKQAGTLGPAACLLFMVLRYHTNQERDDDVVFPSYSTLEVETGLSRPTIAKALTALETNGWIAKKRRFNANTIYTLKYPTQAQLAEAEDASSKEIELLAKTREKPPETTAPVVKKVNSSSSKTLLPVVQKVNSNKTNITRRNQQESKPPSKKIRTYKGIRSIATYQDTLGALPNDVQADMIIETVAEDDKSIAHWLEVCKDWKAHKWNRDNVPGLIDKFLGIDRRNGASHKQSGHGQNKPANQPNLKPVTIGGRTIQAEEC